LRRTPRRNELERHRCPGYSGGRVIEDNLGQPDLTPATVAKKLGISVRLLHRLFEQNRTEPASVTTIVSRRLDPALARLQSVGYRHRTVAVIALD